jgi:hypothetical protein
MHNNKGDAQYDPDQALRADRGSLRRLRGLFRTLVPSCTHQPHSGPEVAGEKQLTGAGLTILCPPVKTAHIPGSPFRLVLQRVKVAANKPARSLPQGAPCLLQARIIARYFHVLFPCLIPTSSNHVHLLMLPTSSTNLVQSRSRLEVVIDDLYVF